jgi:hypothetical protein
MAARRTQGTTTDVEGGGVISGDRDDTDDYNGGQKATGGWPGPLIALGLLAVMSTAAYYERNVLVRPFL